MAKKKVKEEVHELLHYDFLKSQMLIVGFLMFIYIFLMYLVNKGIILNVPILFLVLVNIFAIIITGVFLYYYVSWIKEAKEKMYAKE